MSMRYVAASVTGRHEEALDIVRGAILRGVLPVDVYVDIFQSALYEVGRRWQSRGLTIAEEHMATTTTQFILSVLHEEHPRTGSHRGAAIVTGTVGERHSVGAHIIANVLDEDGWDVLYLGTDVPHDAIETAIDRHRADLVAISVTMSENVSAARDLIAQIRRGNADPPRIIVGGAAFRDDPRLWLSVGADGHAADARSVSEVAMPGSRTTTTGSVEPAVSITPP